VPDLGHGIKGDATESYTRGKDRDYVGSGILTLALGTEPYRAAVHNSHPSVGALGELNGEELPIGVFDHVPSYTGPVSVGDNHLFYLMLS